MSYLEFPLDFFLFLSSIFISKIIPWIWTDTNRRREKASLELLINFD